MDRIVGVRANWAVKRLTSRGLANVKQAPSGGESGRGWSNERTSQGKQ